MRIPTAVVAVIGGASTLIACSKDPSRVSSDYIHSGDRYTSNGDAAAAAVEYRNAVKATPASVEARTRLAQAAARLNDVSTSATELLRAAELAPDSAAAQARAAAVYLLAGRFDQARGLAEAALGLDGDSVAARVVLGQALTALHRPIDGETVLRDAVRASPRDPAARIALAGALWANDLRDDAESELRQARDLDGEDPAVNRALGLLYMATGRSAQAEPLWRRVATSPHGAPFALADYYVAVGRFADAERALAALPAEGELEGLVTLRRAGVAVARGDRSHGLALVRRIRDTDPMRSTAKALEGRMLISDGDQEQAERAFEAALSLNPMQFDALVGMAELRLAQGHAGDAVEWARRARDAAPDAAEPRTLLIQALSAARQPDRALSEAQDAIAVSADQPHAYAQLGAVLALNHQFAAAREALTTSLRLQRGFVPALEVLTSVDLAEQRGSAARERLSQQLATSPTSAPVLVLAARTEVTLGEFARGEALLKRAIAAEPSNLTAYRMLAELYLQRNRTDAALSEFERLAERDPTPAARTAAAVLLQTLGRRDAARQQYETALERHPTAPVAANNLAWMYQEDGRLDEALRLAEVAKRQLGRAPEVNHTLGWIHLRRDEAREALPALADAVATRPDSPMYRAHLGLAYWKTGRMLAARAELDRALAGDAAFVGRDRAEHVRREIAAAPKDSTQRFTDGAPDLAEKATAQP